ncbi:MAG: hypothetical protein JWO08_328 [Verrucomicrobiaceae bacterium]|nr:hypothetical protein [Verrucomicrobiaceae bacterium]
MPDLHSHKGPSFLSYFPLLALVLVGYNIAIFTGHAFNAPNSDTLLQVKLISGATWDLGWHDAFLIGGLCLLFVELMKSTRAGGMVTLEHVLSMFVFIAFLIEFLIVPGAGTDTFLILGIMSLIDVMAGYAISIAVARKEMNITG